MTLPLFLLDAGALDAVSLGGRLVLDGPEGRHAATVRRMRVGEALWVADGAGRRVTGTIAAVAAATLELAIDQVVDLPAPTPALTLVQALAKADRDEDAIEAATELGVDRIIPWQAERSVVIWRGERGEKSRRKWADVVRAATKQSRRAWLPEVEPAVTTAGLVARVRGAGTAYVLHEEAVEPLVAQRLPDQGEVLVIVGPEGGIAPGEVEALTAAGARAVRLGPTVLRSSSAGPAALAVLSAAARWR